MEELAADSVVSSNWKQWAPMAKLSWIIPFHATKAGFKKIVSIIRKDIEEDFKEKIGNLLSKEIDVEYIFHEIDWPEGYCVPS